MNTSLFVCSTGVSIIQQPPTSLEDPLLYYHDRLKVDSGSMLVWVFFSICLEHRVTDSAEVGDEASYAVSLLSRVYHPE